MQAMIIYSLRTVWGRSVFLALFASSSHLPLVQYEALYGQCLCAFIVTILCSILLRSLLVRCFGLFGVLFFVFFVWFFYGFSLVLVNRKKHLKFIYLRVY